MHPISINTYLFIAFFVVAYLIFVIRKTARQQMDLYDFVMLSMVAVIPAVFTFLPNFADWVASLFGVAFPFIVMFGALFLILFLFVHRLTIKVHTLERDNRLLIQEVSLLQQDIDSRENNIEN